MTTKRPRLDSPTLAEEQAVESPEKSPSSAEWQELDQVPQLLLVELAKQSVSDVTCALERLKDLFHSEEKHRTDGIDMGAPVLIVMAMRKWPRELEVQAHGCTCLCWLTFQPLHVGACAITARVGGVEVIVRAMTVFAEVDFIQGDACSMLANIFAAEESTPIQIAAQCFVEQWDGLELIKETMKTYPDYAHLQASCCALLCHLGHYEVFHEKMNQIGLAALAAAALEHHYTDEDVKRNANMFIQLLLST